MAITLRPMLTQNQPLYVVMVCTCRFAKGTYCLHRRNGRLVTETVFMLDLCPAMRHRKSA